MNHSSPWKRLSGTVFSLCSRPLFFYAVFSVVTLLFINASSPLFNYNPSPSPNMFLTIGEGIFEGFVPYRDLWDGKGFAVFFIVGLFGKMFPGIYFGQWILSCICVTLTGYYMYRLASLVLRDFRRAYLPATLCLCLALFQSKMYVLGGVSDEYIMAVMAVALYYGTAAVREGSLNGWKWALMGLCLGLLFWMKFTVCAGPGVLVAAYCLMQWRSGGIRPLFRPLLLTASGFLAVTLPIIGYFAWNDALDSLYYGYYLFHRMYHPHSGVIYLLQNIVTAMLLHPAAFLILGVGLFDQLAAMRTEKYKPALFLSCCFLLAAVYMGSSIHYYFLPLIPYTVFGMCCLTQAGKPLYAAARYAVLTVLVISSGTLYPWTGEPGISRLEVKGARQEVRAIADYCKSHADSSILYFGFMENGAYLHMGQFPTVLYYQLCNFDPVGEQRQQEYLDRKQCAFVLIRRKYAGNGSDATRETEAFRTVRSAGYAPVNVSFTERPYLMLFRKQEDL